MMGEGWAAHDTGIAWGVKSGIAAQMLSAGKCGWGRVGRELGVGWVGVGAGVGAGGVVAGLGWVVPAGCLGGPPHPTPLLSGSPLVPPPPLYCLQVARVHAAPCPGPSQLFLDNVAICPCEGGSHGVAGWVGLLAVGVRLPVSFDDCYPPFPLYLMHSDEKRRFGCKMARVQVRAGLPLLALVPLSPLPPPLPPSPSPSPFADSYCAEGTGSHAQGGARH